MPSNKTKTKFLIYKVICWPTIKSLNYFREIPQTQASVQLLVLFISFKSAHKENCLHSTAKCNHYLKLIFSLHVTVIFILRNSVVHVEKIVLNTSENLFIPVT